MIEGEEYMKREEKQELSVAGKVYDGRVKKEAGRACGAWGMEDGHGHLVKEAFKAGFVQGGFLCFEEPVDQGGGGVAGDRGGRVQQVCVGKVRESCPENCPVFGQFLHKGVYLCGHGREEA